jgi:outer membrane immunogenic protein
MARTWNTSASRWVGGALIVLSLAGFAAGTGSQASANSSPSVAKLEEAIAALEARVAALAPLQARVEALEGRLRQYEGGSSQQALNQEATPRPMLLSLAEDDIQSNPMQVASQMHQASLPEQYKWTGLYWGASFGYGGTKSSSGYSNRQQSRNGGSFNQSSTFRDDDSTETNFDFYTDTYEYIETSTARSQGSDWNGGAVSDLYLGTSFRLAPRILAGVQVEGSLAEMAFESKIKSERTRFSNSDSSTSSSVDNDGGTYRSTNSGASGGTTTTIFDERNKLELDWMVSVIGRAGWLATPSTFLYGLGGWTYGHFDGEDLMFQTGVDQISDFGSHGATVGGGFEQKLSPNWSLRAEYRYTRFAKENFSTKTRFNEARSESGAGRSSDRDTFGGDTETDTSSSSFSSDSTSNATFTSKGYFDNEMHVGRIGVTRYFTWGD